MNQDKLSHAVQLMPTDSIDTICWKASQVKPTPNQLRWHSMEYAAFVHFGMNTFTDREWGDGTENPQLFNPSEMNADEMVSVLKESGMKLVILTCKHHDGFCLWPSKFTEHSVKNSPYKNGTGDVVREFADACQKYDIKFGVYLSPWDRHDSRYGTGTAYNDYYINQLTELLTQYGEISDVWLDGACAEGPSGKKQIYDWTRLYKTVRDLAPFSTISGVAPDVRWCGNEAGQCRESEWNVIPISGTDEFLPEYSDQTAAAITYHNVSSPHICSMEDLGSVKKLQEHAKQSDRLFWYPAQVDLSIRPGWFYHSHEDSDVKNVSALLGYYLSAVGGNTQLLLNIPPDTRGRIHPIDSSMLKILGKILKETFSNNLLDSAEISVPWGNNVQSVLMDNDEFYDAGEHKDTYFDIDFHKETALDLIMLCENIENGQKIEQVEVSVWKNDSWVKAAKATTIGNKRIVRLDGMTASKIRIAIVQSRDIPEITRLGIYKLPNMLEGPEIQRDENGMVLINTKFDSTIVYTLDGSEPQPNSLKYEKPFSYIDGGQVKASAYYSEEVKQNCIETSVESTGKIFGALIKDWSIIETSKNEVVGFPAENLLNDRCSEYVKATGNQYYVCFDMGKNQSITGMLFQPVMEGYDFNFNCTACRIYLSNDGKQWNMIEDKILFDNIYHHPVLQTVLFKKSYSGRYLKFEVADSLRSEYVTLSGLSILTK